MRLRNVFLASAALLLAATSVNATTVDDTTNNVAYYGYSPTNYYGGTSIGDHIGNGFDTKSVTIDASGNSVSLKFYTQFDGNELNTHYADLFLAPSATSAVPASYGYGISLSYQTAHGGEAKGIYALSSAADYETSQQIWGSQTGYTYGGLYIAPDATQQLVPTRVMGGLLETGWTVATSVQNVGGAYPYEIDVTLTATNAAALALLDSEYLDFLWGTGDCANDIIFAQYQRPPSGVPEPASIALVAAGLAGLGLRRRRRH